MASASSCVTSLRLIEFYELFARRDDLRLLGDGEDGWSPGTKMCCATVLSRPWMIVTDRDHRRDANDNSHERQTRAQFVGAKTRGCD